MKEIISLGLGVQSTALYLMSSLGELPRYDCAIFADPGREKQNTYNYLKWLLDWQHNNNGIEIIVINEKNLYADLLKKTNSTSNKFASIPAYTKNEDGTIGMLRRQCTNEYKIAQVDKLIRYAIYKSEPHKRLPVTRIIKGISFDEIDRMNIPKEPWKVHVYPFCGWETFSPGKAVTMSKGQLIMRRAEIIDWFIARGFPVPAKSSCVFCPFQSEFSWNEMKINDPADFEAACCVDDSMRNSSKKGIRQPIFLHESCIPLRNVVFPEDVPDLWSGDCSGTCHI